MKADASDCGAADNQTGLPETILRAGRSAFKNEVVPAKPVKTIMVFSWRWWIGRFCARFT